MKRILLFLMVVITSNVKAESLPTTDYLYATALQTNATGVFFDVYLQGENIYTAYGVDIQLPVGLVGAAASGKPKVAILRNTAGVIYPQDWEEQLYHKVNSSFPNAEDMTHIRVACTGNNENFLTTSGGLFRVYVTKTCADTQWPVGGIKLYAVELNKVGQPYNSPEKTTPVVMYEGTSTLSLNISSSNKWSTCILPFATSLPTGVKAYTSTSSDAENIYLTEAASIAAYTPYVLYSESGFSSTVSGTVDASGYPESGIVTVGNLTGAVTPQSVTSGYVMQNQSGNVAFYAINSGTFAVPAGKCWMNIPVGSAKALNIVLDDATGIQNIKDTSANENSDVIYDVTGRRITNLQKGQLYIKNGEKYITK